MSTHIFPLAGPIDPECAICRKPRSQIEREDADEAQIRENARARRATEQQEIADRLEAFKNTIKTQLATAGIVLVDEGKLTTGYGDYAILYGADQDRIVESIARNLLQLLVLS